MADSTEKTKKPSFFQNVQIEFKKISWPDRKMIIKQSIAVTAIAIVSGVIITLIDFLAANGVKWLTSL